VIRERLAADGAAARTADIGTARVLPISTVEAAALITQFEWLGTMPAVSRHCFGLFFGGALGGAVVYGDAYGENLGVWQRYGLAGKIIALLRLYPLGASARGQQADPPVGWTLLPKHYTVMTATVDDEAGEIGTVCQAAGFDYVGLMHQGGRTLVRINGWTMWERQAGRLTGTQGARALARLGFDAVPVPRRARYFAFRGDRWTRAHHRALSRISSVGRTKAIAYAYFGQDVARPFWISLDLSPELPNVNSQILCVDFLIPQFADQELVGQNLPGMLHECPQQLIFLRR
jgi:hypothetical protein